MFQFIMFPSNPCFNWDLLSASPKSPSPASGWEQDMKNIRSFIYFIFHNANLLFIIKKSKTIALFTLSLEYKTKPT